MRWLRGRPLSALTMVVPDLDCEKTDNQAEDHA